MTTQLELIQTERQWQLDTETKRRGRRGIAEARKVLAQAQAMTIVMEHRDAA